MSPVICYSIRVNSNDVTIIPNNYNVVICNRAVINTALREISKNPFIMRDCIS